MSLLQHAKRVNVVKVLRWTFYEEAGVWIPTFYV